MAKETSRFFDSVNGDKTYFAEEFAEYFRTYFTDGVFSYGANLVITPGTGLSVNIGYGAAIANGYGYWLEDDSSGVKNLKLTASTATPRIDRVVLRCDTSVGNRSIALAIKNGTPATAPTAPALTRSGNIYELSLAQIYVGANALTLQASNITDERQNESLCGLVLPRNIVGYIDQSVETTASVVFASVTATNKISAPIVEGAVYQ